MAKIRYFSGLHFFTLRAMLGDLGLELHISNLGAIYKGRPKIFAIFTPSSAKLTGVRICQPSCGRPFWMTLGH